MSLGLGEGGGGQEVSDKSVIMGVGGSTTQHLNTFLSTISLCLPSLSPPVPYTYFIPFFWDVLTQFSPIFFFFSFLGLLVPVPLFFAFYCILIISLYIYTAIIIYQCFSLLSVYTVVQCCLCCGKVYRRTAAALCGD